MTEIVVKKRIDLDFLGTEHSEDFLIFKSVPVEEYKTITKKQPDDNIQAIDYIVTELKKRYISGKFQGNDIVKDDIGKFPAEVITECHAHITGQKIDPK